MEICQITGIDHKSELPCNNAEEVNAANARLIAAAPELLEALEKINKKIYAKGAPLGTEDYFAIREICCTAIAKARGQQ